MKGLLVVGTLALSSAALIGPCGGKVAMQVKPPSLDAVQKGQEQKKKCEQLKNKPVAFEEERAIGGAVAIAWIKQGGGLVLDAPTGGKLPENEKTELNRFINYVGKNLAALSSRPTLHWTFGVLDTEVMNAYSAPGGYVLVSRGILQKVENEAQLAGVLAHEIGHVTGRHALKLYSEVKANQCSAAAAGTVVGDMVDLQASFNAGVLDSAVGYLDLDKVGEKAVKQLTDSLIDKITSGGFAKNDEYDADRTALQLMIAAGYNPREYIKFLAKLPEADGLWAHHPKNAERQAALEKWLQGIKPSEQAAFSPYADWPFEKYPAVAFKGNELKAAGGTKPASGKR